jgi:hypothetical protein
MRAEQQRQTDELTAAIRDLLRDHAAKEAWPMLGAAASALAENLGETIGQVDKGPLRKSLRDGAMKAARRAERNAKPFGKIKPVAVVGKH